MFPTYVEAILKIPEPLSRERLNELEGQFTNSLGGEGRAFVEIIELQRGEYKSRIERK
jgi:hypothetical protein